MSTYVPKHMSGRAGRLNGAPTSVTALSASRSAVAVGVATAVPMGAAAVLAVPALADHGTTEASSQDGAPQGVLAYGASGDDVASVQRELALVRDGAFGPVATAAIKDFQRANNLDVVGSETWAALQVTGVTSVDGVLAQGSTGPLVRAVQKKPGVTVDGVYGDITEAAVMMFQRTKGLENDGVVGTDTTYALAQVNGAAVSASKPAAPKGDAPAGASRSKAAPAKAAPAKPSLVGPGAIYELPFPAGYAARVSQGPFGAASHHKINDKHHVDFAVPAGTPIVTSASGVVYRMENTEAGRGRRFTSGTRRATAWNTRTSRRSVLLRGNGFRRGRASRCRVPRAMSPVPTCTGEGHHRLLELHEHPHRRHQGGRPDVRHRLGARLPQRLRSPDVVEPHRDRADGAGDSSSC